MLVLFGAMIVFLLMGLEIGIAMGCSGLVYIIFSWFGPTPLPVTTIAQNFFYATDAFALLAIPMFILAGELMNKGGMTADLVDFAKSLIGHITGGLGNVSVLANMIMSGMSGSAPADCSATGSILIPAMVRDKYPPQMACAIIAAAATIGPIIPPSIAMVIIGGMTGVSIGKLFLGGVIPGTLMGLSLLVAVYVIAKRGEIGSLTKFSWREVLRCSRAAFLSLLMPLIILGTIVFGIATPTEAAGVAAAYAAFLGFVVYKQLTLRIVFDILKQCAVTTASIMFTVAGATVISWVSVAENFGPWLAQLFLSITDNPVIILLIINVLLLILGFPLEPLPLIMIFIPILMPLITKLGIDPVHFIVMFTINIQLALVTPPVGTNLFLVSAIAKCPVSKVSYAAIPYLTALTVILLLVTLFPALTVWLPNALMG